LNYETDLRRIYAGFTPDISGLVQHKFWDKVYYLEYESDFPTQGGSERKGRWLGRALNYGDKMCYYVLTDDTKQIIVRSMVRSAVNTDRPNRGLPLDANEPAKEKVNPPIIYTIKGKHELQRAPKLKGRGQVMQFDPEKLLDLVIYEKYTTKRGKEAQMRGRVKEQVDNNLYRVAFDNGKQRVYEYDEIVNKVNKPDDDDEERWTFEEIVGHRWSPEKGCRGKIDLLLKWDGYEHPTWEPMEIIKKDDPISVAMYAQKKNLLEQAMWRWAGHYIKNKKRMNNMYRQMMASKRKKTGPKYQFGVRVPRSIKEAYELDELNKDSGWADAIQKEVTILKDTYSCFNILGEEEEVPKEYNQITLLWTFAVKYDGRKRARCVAGGHMTPDLEEDLYSGVVDLEVVRLAFVAATLQDLRVIAADIGSAYIQAYTNEKVFVIAGPEFGALKGRKMIIVKALYGLKSAGANWHQKLADNLFAMGFLPSKADYNLWIRDRGDHYDYVAVIVDDLLILRRGWFLHEGV